MTVLLRPLGNRIARPLMAGTVWGTLAVVAAAGIALLVTAGGWAVGAIRDLVGSGSAVWSWALFGDVAAALGPLTIVSATWAAVYASAHEGQLGRAAAGSLLGITTLVALAVFDWPGALAAAAAAAWSVGLPFDHWDRLAARTLGALVIVGLLGWWVADATDGGLAAVIASSFPTAALGVWLGDAAWRLVARARASERDGGVADESDE